MCCSPWTARFLAMWPNIWIPKPPSRSLTIRCFQGRRTIWVVSRRVVLGWVMMWSAIWWARVTSSPRGITSLTIPQSRACRALMASPVSRAGADVVVQVEESGIVRGQGDVTHQHDLGVESGPVEQADGRDLQVVDQGTDVDPPVLVGVLVSPVLQVGLLEGEALGIGGHHELLARPGQDEHLVLRIRPDRLQHLAEGAVVLHAELDGAAQGVRGDEQDAVLASLHPEEVPERLPVVLEPGSRHEFL